VEIILSFHELSISRDDLTLVPLPPEDIVDEREMLA